MDVPLSCSFSGWVHVGIEVFSIYLFVSPVAIRLTWRLMAAALITACDFQRFGSWMLKAWDSRCDVLVVPGSNTPNRSWDAAWGFRQVIILWWIFVWHETRQFLLYHMRTWGKCSDLWDTVLGWLTHSEVCHNLDFLGQLGNCTLAIDSKELYQVSRLRACSIAVDR